MFKSFQNEVAEKISKAFNLNIDEVHAVLNGEVKSHVSVSIKEEASPVDTQPEALPAVVVEAKKNNRCAQILARGKGNQCSKLGKERYDGDLYCKPHYNALVKKNGAPAQQARSPSPHSSGERSRSSSPTTSEVKVANPSSPPKNSPKPMKASRKVKGSPATKEKIVSRIEKERKTRLKRVKRPDGSVLNVHPTKSFVFRPKEHKTHSAHAYGIYDKKTDKVLPLDDSAIKYLEANNFQIEIIAPEVDEPDDESSSQLSVDDSDILSIDESEEEDE